ncbi:MAG: hypothetical protein CL677_00920 [Bdellovibrionaceae bacterium]|nr:hypothetical protein [Pseudobdellovibrionaceae bacterium]|tara:strand:- start:17694 stop:18554 length:861 start_codon:yes stop_codon:yes gene_type:complete
MGTLTLGKKLAVAALALTAFSGVNNKAEARERVRLELNQTLRGNQQIGLKRELRQQTGMRASDFKLEAVRVIAKSKQGNGTVELLIDGMSQDLKGLSGNAREFDSDLPRTFDRVLLENHARGRANDGPWKLETRGNVKIKAIVLLLEDNRNVGPTPQPPVRPAPRPRPLPPLPPGRHHGRVVNVHLGEEKADKFITERHTFQLSGSHVRNVVLEGTKEKVRVEAVYLHYITGRVDRLVELEGTLRDGDLKQAHVAGRAVQMIEVEVTSPNLFGSRGKYAISADVLR